MIGVGISPSLGGTAPEAGEEVVAEPSLTVPGAQTVYEIDENFTLTGDPTTAYTGESDLELRITSAGTTINVVDTELISITGNDTSSVVVTGTVAGINAAIASPGLSFIGVTAGLFTISMGVRRVGQEADADTKTIGVTVKPPAPAVDIADNGNGSASLSLTSQGGSETHYRIFKRVNGLDWEPISSGALPYGGATYSSYSDGDIADVKGQVKVVSGGEDVWSDEAFDSVTMVVP